MDWIARAFPGAPDLQSRVRNAQSQSPELRKLFNDIALFIDSQNREKNSASALESKKRKLDEAPNGTQHDHSRTPWDTGAVATISDISFSVPVRKKLRLEIGSQASQGIRATNTQTGDVELQIQWRELEQVVCLPVPEKAQPQYSFCIFPKHGMGLSVSSSDGTTQDQLVWGVPEAAPKLSVCNNEAQVAENESYKDILLRILNNRLFKYRKDIKGVTEPSEQEFTSELAQAHRKGEKAYHVKAFRGSKDGFLFFLSTGIVWGFKKPLAFFAFDAIESISYTSVLQRTFNLNIITRTSVTDTQEIEFSMVDQADFAGIDAYIKRHELQDASMAEQRRAKKYNVNKIKGEQDGEDNDAEPRELEKAQQEAHAALQDDEEDEEDDENFDPGSEGESEGSGSSSSEQEDGDQQMNDADDDNDDEG